MLSLSIVKHCPQKNVPIHDYEMTNSHRGGGPQIPGRTILCCERCPDFPDQSNTAGAPTCFQFKQHCFFVNMASVCLFSFLSFYFLPFFSEASQVAAAKRSGRWLQVTDTQQHSGHQQHPGLKLSGREELDKRLRVYCDGWWWVPKSTYEYKRVG